MDRYGKLANSIIFFLSSSSSSLSSPTSTSSATLSDSLNFFTLVSACFVNIRKEYLVRRGRGDQTTCNVQDTHDMFVRDVVQSNSPAMDSDFIALAILDTSVDLLNCRRRDDYRKVLIVGDSWFEDVMRSLMTDRSIVCNKQYLATVGKDLVQVVRLSEFGKVEDCLGYKTASFKAFRLDWSLNELRWEQIDSLGKYEVFMGTNSSLSVCALPISLDVSGIGYTSPKITQNGWLRSIIGEYISSRDRRVDFSCFRGYDSVPTPIWLSPDPC
ncbi:hypothetical protein MLD38_022173 [Melastoma candidum]|uniref:Uncharacterized protein n=1 Tax=Melastoma candidum TaxID=119954 RepID=A0ACB9QRJ1_9MYRT|nr:hypothetical protein MLD38_022173 [Melastoma candidum]